MTELKENVGTPLYQSPEQIEGKIYNEKVDIFSLGLILLELCGHFKTQSERRLTIEKIRFNGFIPDKIKAVYPVEYDLIKIMIAKHYWERPSTSEILESKLYKELSHKYFAD